MAGKAPKRYRLRNLALREVSLVDEPANGHAVVTILKRSDEMDHKEMEKEMTDDQRRRFREMMEKGTSASEAFTSIMGKAYDAKKSADAEVQALTKAVEVLRAENEALAKAVETAGGKIEKSANSAIKITLPVEKAAPEEMIEVGGQRIAKSAVPEGLLAVIEKQVADTEALKKAAVDADLRKRASSMFPNLAGDEVAKGELLRALESIPEAHRDAVMKSMKAADAAVSTMFIAKSRDALGDDTGPQAELDAMVAKHVADKGVSPEIAFSEITKSGKGRELLLAARASKASAH